MKKIAFALMVLVSSYTSFSQDLPQIIPPSPEASAFHVYGNTTANNYTGSTNISIPIFTIKEGDLTLPIYLKYTGSNGIKVEEIASWVGLGWTLNAGGAISRTVRGVEDDDDLYGLFTNNSPIPTPNSSNYNFFKDIGDNKKDGQPDKFFYNYPNGSGSFFYNYNETPFFKQRNKIDIQHNKGVAHVTGGPANCATYNEIITDLTLKDEYGAEYYFNDKERSNTRTLGGTYTDDRSFPSTWYLSKMTDRNGNREINFTYDQFYYTLKRRSSVINIGPVETSNEMDSYTETTYIAKRLNTITFNQGSVEFVESTDYRKDLSFNKYLKEILIKNKHNQTVKKFQFTYKYMTPTGLVDVNTTLSGSPIDYRLVLTAVKECDASNNCKPETKFTYETTHLLPSRESRAQDHWGYYNGQNLNTKLEPKQYITFKNPYNNWETIEEGSSNREVNSSFAKSGILTSIEYPTGGRTEFEYESHSAKTDKVAGLITTGQTTMYWNGQNNKVNFTVNVHSEPYHVSKLRIGGLISNPVNCDVRVFFRKANTNDNPLEFLMTFSGGGLNNYTVSPEEFFLEAGSYEAWFTFESGTQSCIQNDPALITLLWDEENPNENKIIGGLRIKHIYDYDETLLVNKQNFEYSDDDGFSSGRVEYGPKYHRLKYDDFIISVPSANGFHRYVNSLNPLIASQGSPVGYKKVTVSTFNKELGKTEYYYTTTDEYKDGYNGINPSTEEPQYEVFNGRKVYPYPFVEPSSNDYLRGSLIKEIIYKKNSTSFDTILKKEFKYIFMAYFPDSVQTPQESDNVINSGYSKMFKAAKVYNWYGPNHNNIHNPPTVYVSFYNVFNGYNLLKETKETHYNASGLYTKTIIKTYNENSNDIIDYHVPITTEKTDSRGNTNKTETTYVFNKTSKTLAESALESDNAIHIPLATKSYNGTTLLGHQYTSYDNSNANWSGLNLPEKIQTSKGGQSLEDRIIYHSYDDKGNPTEVSKKGGTKIYYIWGYHQTQPIAKIEGHTDVQLNNISSLISSAVSASDSDSSRCLQSTNCNETTLRNALNAIRNNSNMANAQVTTFTYDPLIGVTSITDPRGEIVYYEYDNFNRLKYVRDKNNRILSTTEYNYKN